MASAWAALNQIFSRHHESVNEQWLQENLNAWMQGYFERHKTYPMDMIYHHAARFEGGNTTEFKPVVKKAIDEWLTLHKDSVRWKDSLSLNIKNHKFAETPKQREVFCSQQIQILTLEKKIAKSVAKREELNLSVGSNVRIRNHKTKAFCAMNGLTEDYDIGDLIIEEAAYMMRDRVIFSLVSASRKKFEETRKRRLAAIMTDATENDETGANMADDIQLTTTGKERFVMVIDHSEIKEIFEFEAKFPIGTHVRLNASEFTWSSKTTDVSNFPCTMFATVTKVFAEENSMVIEFQFKEPIKSKILNKSFRISQNLVDDFTGEFTGEENQSYPMKPHPMIPVYFKVIGGKEKDNESPKYSASSLSFCLKDLPCTMISVEESAIRCSFGNAGSFTVPVKFLESISTEDFFRICKHEQQVQIDILKEGRECVRDDGKVFCVKGVGTDEVVLESVDEEARETKEFFLKNFSDARIVEALKKKKTKIYEVGSYVKVPRLSKTEMELLHIPTSQMICKNQPAIISAVSEDDITLRFEIPLHERLRSENLMIRPKPYDECDEQELIHGWRQFDFPKTLKFHVYSKEEVAEFTKNFRANTTGGAWEIYPFPLAKLMKDDSNHEHKADRKRKNVDIHQGNSKKVKYSLMPEIDHAERAKEKNILKELFESLDEILVYVHGVSLSKENILSRPNLCSIKNKVLKSKACNKGCYFLMNAQKGLNPIQMLPSEMQVFERGDGPVPVKKSSLRSDIDFESAKGVNIGSVIQLRFAGPSEARSLAKDIFEGVVVAKNESFTIVTANYNSGAKLHYDPGVEVIKIMSNPQASESGAILHLDRDDVSMATVIPDLYMKGNFLEARADKGDVFIAVADCIKYFDSGDWWTEIFKSNDKHLVARFPTLQRTPPLSEIFHNQEFYEIFKYSPETKTVDEKDSRLIPASMVYFRGFRSVEFA